MIIPVRCMSCGKPLADKYRYFLEEVRKRSGERGTEPMILDGTSIPKTAEAEVFRLLYLRRYCCKKTLNTHVNLISKF
jgi:DNA-directed RNA polymerase subunit N (RpoN/RPB10)